MLKCSEKMQAFMHRWAQYLLQCYGNITANLFVLKTDAILNFVSDSVLNYLKKITSVISICTPRHFSATFKLLH